MILDRILIVSNRYYASPRPKQKFLKSSYIKKLSINNSPLTYFYHYLVDYLFGISSQNYCRILKALKILEEISKVTLFIGRIN